MSEVRIGVSGWTYPEWRGNFYPKGLVQKRELEYASRQMNSIEMLKLPFAAGLSMAHDRLQDVIGELNRK